MKQDQMSMATAIESRVPFLDHEFVEFSTRVPRHMKLRRIQGKTEGKYILKKAIERLVPREIVHREKMVFPTPLRQCPLDPRADHLCRPLRSRRSPLATYLNPAALAHLLYPQTA